MNYINTLNDKITKHCEVIKTIENQNKNIEKIIKIIVKKLKSGGKILLCGNGGSDSEAEHFVQPSV